MQRCFEAGLVWGEELYFVLPTAEDETLPGPERFEGGLDLQDGPPKARGEGSLVPAHGGLPGKRNAETTKCPISATTPGRSVPGSSLRYK